MSVLTYNEGLAIDVIRRQHKRYNDAVAAWDVRDRLLHSHGVRYDSANRALRGLVDKGVASKPSRGYYLPSTPEEQ